MPTVAYNTHPAVGVDTVQIYSAVATHTVQYMQPTVAAYTVQHMQPTVAAHTVQHMQPTVAAHTVQHMQPTVADDTPFSFSFDGRKTYKIYRLVSQYVLANSGEVESLVNALHY